MGTQGYGLSPENPAFKSPLRHRKNRRSDRVDNFVAVLNPHGVGCSPSSALERVAMLAAASAGLEVAPWLGVRAASRGAGDPLGSLRPERLLVWSATSCLQFGALEPLPG